MVLGWVVQFVSTVGLPMLQQDRPGACGVAAGLLRDIVLGAIGGECSTSNGWTAEKTCIAQTRGALLFRNVLGRVVRRAAQKMKMRGEDDE